eukprot:TRINITY_DN14317_c0_g1_i1.p1 TRINITY_DN14317_c0_g1~~TRINITY_DN14317_c0_g1_i1.p1  ORF type:complete len:728 (-),score=115.70 TRINITY_DN14317_c0_g1_i1:12-2195(-)
MMMMPLLLRRPLIFLFLLLFYTSISLALTAKHVAHTSLRVPLPSNDGVDGGDGGDNSDSSGYILQIDPWGRDSVRVRVATRIRDDVPWALLPPDHILHNVSIIYHYEDDDDDDHEGKRNDNNDDDHRKLIKAEITNGNLQVIVDMATGLVVFIRVSDGVVLTQELVRTITPNALGYLTLNVTYEAFDDERIFGFGSHKIGKLDNKNQTYILKQSITYDLSHGGVVAIPFVTSSRGYGFFWNMPSFGIVTFNTSGSYWSSEASYQYDIWLTTSSSSSSSRFVPSDIISNYADATGHPPPFPDFATGFIQSKDRYRNQTQLISVAQGYKQRDLPISTIVIDWFHWTDYGDYRFNLNCWPDAKDMVKQIKAMGIDTMVTVWPLIDGKSINFPVFNNSHYLVRCPSGTPVDNCHTYAPYYLYDPTNPEARKYLWSLIVKGYYSNGIKLFWLDAAEPEQFDPVPRHIYSAGPEELLGMAYDLYHHQTFYDGMKSMNESSVFLLSRSAWAGCQRYGAAVWSGDTSSDFADLQQQVRIGLNMGLSGIYWWTSDIGGYSNGNITDPMFQELIVRWFQFGAFCPLFRLHGHRIPQDPDSATCGTSGGPNEVWEFGSTAYDSIRSVMMIRASMKTYIAQNMALASKSGIPIMRPLWFDFASDARTLDIDDQFMFGPDYMMAPVLEYKATNRTVYFPQGAQWLYYFDHSMVYQGGVSVVVPISSSDLSTFLLYVRKDI